MNAETISLPQDQARAKLEAYRSYLRKTKLTKANQDVRREYEEAERAYKILAEGKRLVNVEEVIAKAPRDHKHRPKLAMGRADCKEVRFAWHNDGRVIFDSNGSRSSANSKVFRQTFSDPFPDNIRWSTAGFALIPMIPADVMPARCDTSKHWILWEVDQWSDESKMSRPSRDPFLLKHIGGPLYAIVAEWDLTDLEMMLVLGRRRDQ